MSRRLKDRRKSIDYYSLEGKLSEVIKYFKELQLEFGNDAIINIDLNGYDCYPEADILYKTPETDAERNKRLTTSRKVRERKQKKKLEDDLKEQEQLIQLTEKHGDIMGMKELLMRCPICINCDGYKNKLVYIEVTHENVTAWAPGHFCPKCEKKEIKEAQKKWVQK